MSALPLFKKQEDRTVVLELNWLLPAVIPGFVRELQSEIAFANLDRRISFDKNQQTREIFNLAMIASIRRGYTLKVQSLGPDLFRLNYDLKSISKPSAVKRWFEKNLRDEEPRPFEIRYAGSHLRAAMPLRRYRGGIHCLTIAGYRNFSLDRIYSIHPVRQANLGTDATLEFRMTRKGVKISQGLVTP
jgi:hypothetical protein